MKLSVLYPALWVAWIVAFLVIEFSALLTGHSQFTLSDLVWKLEQVHRSWTALRFFVCVFCAWLFFHMVYGFFG